MASSHPRLIALGLVLAAALPAASHANARERAVQPARVASPAPLADGRAFGFVAATVSLPGEVRQMTFLPGKPQRIQGTIVPLAVAFRPHTTDAMALELYSILADGSMRLLSSQLAGKQSLQLLGGYGLSLQLRTAAEGEQPGC
jgi:hypothetical protein